ncbi:MAG: ABC transporter permease [Gammaproteobacteria bacterium]|nr:ABC transporter permease [Gammaproteobacteria bacterium]
MERRLMAVAASGTGASGGGLRRLRWSALKRNAKLWRGAAAIALTLVLWECGSRASQQLGMQLPFIGLIPPPTAVLAAWAEVIPQFGYWESWYLSFKRVLAGFLSAMVVGIPFGLLLAVSRYCREIFFPPFEVLRPIPPLAWVPASLIFWPTNELSIAFVTFLGAFFTIVINVLGGARSIDIRLLRAAQSMGATKWDMFWRIVLPASLPSIFTGAAVGMGITWEVVLAAEMISGGGTQGGGGLGFFIWNSYMGGSLEQIVVGMFSIGIAGYLSSSAIRYLGDRCMPWRRLF